MLEVRLIGKFEIQCDGKPVRLPSRTAQSLFAYLILTAGTLHRREKLAGMLWPEESEQKARTYLRNELWRIRKVLPHTPNVEYVVADNLTMGFNPSCDYWLDVGGLKNMRNEASTDEMIAGLSCYAGELLPGFYEDWVVLEREHLQVLFEQKIAVLLERLENEQRWADLLAWAERWISLGQAPEAAFRALMVAYDALGDHAKVASTYERCKQALHQLDLEPSEETRVLAFKRSSKIKVPIPITSFVGREKEIKELAGLFPKSRLITLTGSGGVGKTRLAIQVVAEVMDLFPDGVWFLDLAPLTDPSLIPNALVRLLGLHEAQEISVTELLVNYFSTRRTLVIFDNCEHLIESCAQLIFLLLTSCEHLTVLATSRETLRVSGEIPYRVPSLEVPRLVVELTIDELSNIESMKLFAERATFASLGFTINLQNATLISHICQRLDGIPLAIELAAARVNELTIEQILKQLDNRFNLLTNGLRSTLPRHQTLRATMEWSYDLLSEKERIVFRRLAVFIGGWTLEAAEKVCTWNGIESSEILGLLAELVRKSLIVVATIEGEARYRTLEMMSRFAWEKLAESDEVKQVGISHLNYFTKLGKKAESELHGARQIEWLNRLENEHENLRVALEWSLQNDVTAGQELAEVLWWSWLLNGHESEGYEWLERMLTMSFETKTLIRAKLLSGQGELAHHLGYYEKAEKLSEESVSLFRELGDEAGTAFPLGTLGMISNMLSDYNQAAQLISMSLDIAKRAGNQWEVGRALRILSRNANLQGDFVHSRKFLEESLLISKEIGDQEGLTFTLYLIAEDAVSQGNLVGAMELYEEVLEFEKALKRKFATADILTEMGYLANHLGDYEKGSILLSEAMELQEEISSQGNINRLLRLGWTERLQQDYSKAHSHYREVLELLKQWSNKEYAAACLVDIGILLGVQGSPEKFARLLGVAEGHFPNLQKKFHPLSRTETKQYSEIARIALGNEAYTAAYEGGHLMSLDEAITFALKEL